jgi:transposase
MNEGPTAQERAMKVRQVLLRAMSGELSWIQASEILGLTPRTVRRWRERLERQGLDGLVDRRRGPSPHKAPMKLLEQVLRLYRTRYRGFNVRHFHAVLRREHAFTYGYTFVRVALQEAGLVRKHRPRGRHRLRREPRACFGELLHLDGRPHEWLARCPGERFDLIAVVDDATKRLLYAQLAEAGPDGAACVIVTHGVPMALYTDRAGWAAVTRRHNEPVDKNSLTQVGRALRRLGIEHILAYSPQARGRSERVNRTLQDRLVNELRVAGIDTLEAANRYLNDRFLPTYNEEFARRPADPARAFVTAGGADLDQILCFEHERTVAKDNTVNWEGLCLQIGKQPGRATGLTVTVRHHLDRSFSVWRGTQCWARLESKGRLQHKLSPTSRHLPASGSGLNPSGQSRVKRGHFHVATTEESLSVMFTRLTTKLPEATTLPSWVSRWIPPISHI